MYYDDLGQVSLYAQNKIEFSDREDTTVALIWYQDGANHSNIVNLSRYIISKENFIKSILVFSRQFLEI